MQEIIPNNLDKPWDWGWLLKYDSWITTRVEGDWIWDNRANLKIVWAVIKNEPDKKWDWEYISHHISWKTIKDNPNHPWDWESISYNEEITLQIIKDNPDKPWNWKALSSRGFMNLQIILDNLDKPLDFNHLNYWYSPITSLFMKDKYSGINEWINERRLQHIKVFQIQRHWRNCTSNPQFSLAKKLLL
jgi:hypothetical protein